MVMQTKFLYIMHRNRRRGKSMRKMVASVLAASLSLSLLAGCGSTTDSSTSSTASTAASKTDDSASTSTDDSTASSDAFANLPEKWLDADVVATPEMYPNVDMSKPYTVNLYQVGDTPTDWDEVEAAINEYLEPFNTSIKTTFMSWSDVSTMYSLVLAGGEQIDAIFTAPWEYMYTEAAKGSFYTFDRDWVTANMPLTDSTEQDRCHPSGSRREVRHHRAEYLG
jgi:putative aldouronate transport system substrate-binding protein